MVRGSVWPIFKPMIIVFSSFLCLAIFRWYPVTLTSTTRPGSKSFLPTLGAFPPLLYTLKAPKPGKQQSTVHRDEKKVQYLGIVKQKASQANDSTSSSSSVLPPLRSSSSSVPVNVSGSSYS